MPVKKAEIPVGVALSMERYQQLLRTEADLALANEKLKEYEGGFFGRAAARLMRQCEVYSTALTPGPWMEKRLMAAIKRSSGGPGWEKKAVVEVLKTINDEVARRLK